MGVIELNQIIVKVPMFSFQNINNDYFDFYIILR